MPIYEIEKHVMILTAPEQRILLAEGFKPADLTKLMWEWKVAKVAAATVNGASLFKLAGLDSEGIIAIGREAQIPKVVTATADSAQKFTEAGYSRSFIQSIAIKAKLPEVVTAIAAQAKELQQLGFTEDQVAGIAGHAKHPAIIDEIIEHAGVFRKANIDLAGLVLMAQAKEAGIIQIIAENVENFQQAGMEDRLLKIAMFAKDLAILKTTAQCAKSFKTRGISCELIESIIYEAKDPKIIQAVADHMLNPGISKEIDVVDIAKNATSIEVIKATSQSAKSLRKELDAFEITDIAKNAKSAGAVKAVAEYISRFKDAGIENDDITKIAIEAPNAKRVQELLKLAEDAKKAKDALNAGLKQVGKAEAVGAVQQDAAAKRKR